MSSIEEYQSVNEELRSANEALTTSKEELQSVNEELQTVNAELARRVSDLGRANGDLRNLLDSTQIATIFLDNDLRVRSFTPAAKDIFHLLESDIGRPVEHLGSRVIYGELNDDVRMVITNLGTVEREVHSKDGGHFVARVLPYRSADNFIVGAVLTFMDITSTVKAEAALRENEGRLRLLLAELQHRVRNTLAMVKSIALRTAESSTSVEQMAEQLAGRLDAFARVQSVITSNPDARMELAALIEDELKAHALNDGERLSIDGPPISLQSRPAESMSLAIHELATNAVKHGALANGGKIDVKWRVEGSDGQRHLRFEWIEDGLEEPLSDPSRRGFGLELLTRILPYDLRAKTDVAFKPTGLRFSLHAPLDGLIGETE